MICLKWELLRIVVGCFLRKKWFFFPVTLVVLAFGVTGLHISVIFIIWRVVIVLDSFLVVDPGAIGALLVMRE